MTSALSISAIVALALSILACAAPAPTAVARAQAAPAQAATQGAPYAGPTVADVRNQWWQNEERHPQAPDCQWVPGLPAAFEMQALQARGCTTGDVTVNPFDFENPQTVDGSDFSDH